MSIGKTITIDGHTVSNDCLTRSLKAMPGTGFSKAEFADALIAQGFAPAADRDLVRRIMQILKQHGLIDFDPQAQLWSLTALGHMRMPSKTLPLSVSPTPNPLPAISPLDRLTDVGQGFLRIMACFGLIGALITLNASFAWELGREADQFRFAFVVGLMALDLMRPFLVATGFKLWGKRVFGRAVLGFLVAFALAPVSILSSTAILSSSFLLGAEMSADATLQTETLGSLRAEHTRRLAEAERLNDAWRVECTRGGCGPLAAEIEADFLTAQQDAQAVLDRIVFMTDASNGASDLLARMVLTFERLGLFGQGREILLPLFLAISLELGAPFGPALLLGRRRQ